MTVLGVLVGHVSVIMQRQFQQIVEFLTEWWTLQLHADLDTHSAHCTADRGDLQVTVLGMVVDAPVVVQRQVPRLGRTGRAERWGTRSKEILGKATHPWRTLADTPNPQYLLYKWSP